MTHQAITQPSVPSAPVAITAVPSNMKVADEQQRADHRARDEREPGQRESVGDQHEVFLVAKRNRMRW